MHLSLSLSLSLYLPIRRCTPERMCMHQSLSLSFSVYICKNGLDPDQTRMELRKECFANRKICACYWKYAKAMRTIRWVFSIYIGQSHAGQGSGGPENHKNIEYLSNTGPDPLKFSKIPSQHSTLGHHRHPSQTPFKWRFAGGPTMAR